MCSSDLSTKSGARLTNNRVIEFLSARRKKKIEKKAKKKMEVAREEKAKRLALEKEPVKIFGPEEGKLLVLKKDRESRHVRMKETRETRRKIRRRKAVKATAEILAEMPI